MVEFRHLQQALNEYAEAIKTTYKDKLVESDRRATGNLITSVNTKVTANGQQYEIELNLMDYWRFVEYGTKPHFPPVNKILEWVRVKPVLPHPDKNGKLPTEKQLAFLIARKISVKGTEGSFDLNETMDEVDFTTIIEDAIDLDVFECIDELLLMFKL